MEQTQGLTGQQVVTTEEETSVQGLLKISAPDMQEHQYVTEQDQQQIYTIQQNEQSRIALQQSYG